MNRSDRNALPIAREFYGATEPWTAFSEGLGVRKPARGGAAKRAVVAAAVLGAIAWYVRSRSDEADRRRPPQGRFVDVDGVRLHYVMRGEGPPVVLLHGNGSMIDELESSGLVDLLAQHYRVIVFDRPGFGHSERPPGRDWTAQAQAGLLAFALAKLGIERATIVGHSWGTLVALALALDHPRFVRGLVLASGYYYPTFRPDALLLSAPAWPVVGALMSRTTSPALGRLLWPAILRMAFGPPQAPAAFRGLSPWRFLKPERLRAGGAESGMLTGEAAKLSRRYGEIRVPTVILAGERDRIVGLRHAQRLNRAIAGSRLDTVAWAGHMIHHIVPQRVLRAIDAVALQDARGAGPASERADAQPLRELIREVPHQHDPLGA